MAESDSKRRPFRSLGLRLRSFGRNVFRTYSPADSSPQSTNDVPRPSWQQNTDIPLLWDEQSNDNALPQQPYTEVLPAPDQPLQRRTVTPQPRRSPQQLPRQNQPRQQQPQQQQQVQRAPQQGSDDDRLYRIMAFHRERQAKSDALKATVQAKREDSATVSPPRRRRPSFDYVDTRSIGGEDTPEKSQAQSDDNAPDDWDLPPVDGEADYDTVQLSASDDAPVQRRQPDIIQRDSVPQQDDNDVVDEPFSDEAGDEDFLAPELDYDEGMPETQDQPQSLSSDSIQPSRIIQRSPIVDADDSNDYIEETPPTNYDNSPVVIDNGDSQSLPPQQPIVQRDFDDASEVETGFDYGDDDAPIEANTASPVQLQRQIDDTPTEASVQREVYEGDDSGDYYEEDGYTDDDGYQNDAPVDTPHTDVQQSIQREVYEGDDGGDYYEEDGYTDDDGYQNDAPVDTPHTDVQQSVQREVYEGDDGGDYYEEDGYTDEDGYQNDAPVDTPHADVQQSVQREIYADDNDEQFDDFIANDNDVPSDAPDVVQRTIDHQVQTPVQPNANDSFTSQPDFPRTAQELPTTQDDGDFAEWVQDVSDDSVDVQRDYDGGENISQDRSSSPRRAVISEVNTEDYDHLYDTHIPSYHNDQDNTPIESGYPDLDMGQPSSVNVDGASQVQREVYDDYDVDSNQAPINMPDEAPQSTPSTNAESEFDNTVSQTAPDVSQSSQGQIVQRNHDVVPIQPQSPPNLSGRNEPNNDDVEIVFPGDHIQRVMDDGDGQSNQVDLFTALQQAGVVPPSAGDNPVQRQVTETPPSDHDRSAFPSDVKAYGSFQDISPQTQHTVSRTVSDSPVEDVSASIEDADEAGGGQPNIDKIARDVYNRLKNRLRIERERRHNK